MFSINASGQKILLSDVKSGELNTVLKWYNNSKYAEATGVEDQFSFKDLWAKYVEFLNSGEIFFCSVIRIRDQVPLGFIKGLLDFDTSSSTKKIVKNIWIQSILILDEFQNNGYGKETFLLLADAVQQLSRPQMPVRAVVSVAKKNLQGVIFWHRLGFEKAEKFLGANVTNRNSEETLILCRPI